MLISDMHAYLRFFDDLDSGDWSVLFLAFSFHILGEFRVPVLFGLSSGVQTDQMSNTKNAVFTFGHVLSGVEHVFESNVPGLCLGNIRAYTTDKQIA